MTEFTTPGGFILHDLLEVKNKWPGGISYQTIASRAGLSKAHVVRLFQGKGNPSVETLVAIANALDRALSFELLQDDEDEATSTQLSVSPDPEEDCERCEGIGSLGFGVKPGGPQGFDGVLTSEHCPDCNGTGKKPPRDTGEEPGREGGEDRG